MKIAQIGEECLRIPARQVAAEEFNQFALIEFTQTLLSTMLEANGIGIAAPQVFDARAIMIIASRPNIRYPNAPLMEPLTLINPQIVQQGEANIWEWEGCLSVPGLRGKILRPDWVQVRYQSIDGEIHQQKLQGFIARVFLHEYDHLIGKTWLDHVSQTNQIMANDVWLKALEDGCLYQL